jgi:hypothetical protein
VYLTGVVSLLARAMRIDVSNFFAYEIPPETPEIYQMIQTGNAKLDSSDACLFANKGAINGVKSRSVCS